MKELTKPGSRIISHGKDMYEVLAQHIDRGYDKEKLGYLVKYYGGTKLLKKKNVLYICKDVQDAIIE